MYAMANLAKALKDDDWLVREAGAKGIATLVHVGPGRVANDVDFVVKAL